MDDAACVHGRQRGQHPERRTDRLTDRHRSLLQAIGERLPFEQLHRDEERAGVFTDFVNLTDVGMVDARRRSRLRQNRCRAVSSAEIDEIVLSATGR